MKITGIKAYRIELPLHEGSYKWSGGKSVAVLLGNGDGKSDIVLQNSGTVALWIVMLFALASGVDYFIKFSRAILRPDKKSEN